MPRTKRKKASEDRTTVTRKRRTSAGHEPILDVNNLAATVKEPFASETNIKEGCNGDGTDHAEVPYQAPTAPQQEQRSADENKSDDGGAVDTSIAIQDLPRGSGDPVSRNERIRRMVEHRKQLLRRIRQGKTAVEKRLASQPATATTDEEEIAHFLDMVKSVNSELRKQQQQTQQSQKQQQEAAERRSAARRGSAAQKRNSAVASVLTDELETSLRSAASSKRPSPPPPPPIVVAPPKKKIICAETEALRQHRNATLSKLKFPAKRSSPPRLPCRRKTHWDTLLQEMAWAATDFREERKWKIAAARWMGDEIGRSQGAQSTGKTAIKSRDINPSPQSERRGDEPMAIDDISGEKEEIDAVPEAVSEPSDTVIEEILTSDDMELRRVASILSRNVIGFFRDDPEHETVVENTNVSAETSSDDLQNGLEVEPPRNGILAGKIDQYIDVILDSIKAEPPTARRSRSELYGQKLSETQIKVVQAIEDRWHRINVGVCLKGPVAAGKTIAACSLLWRHRTKGAQLVVCSLAGLIRWIHELKRFSELKPNVLELGTLDAEMNQCSVLVCTHSAIGQVTAEQLRRFHTIVLDKRYPTGFSGSRIKVEKEDISSSAPEEFSDIDWWTKLSAASSNRVVVEKAEASFGFLQYTSNRQRLSIMALYMGFLLGTHVFEMKHHSVEKSILVWGRHRVKRMGKPIESKYRRVHTLFSSICDVLQCHIDGRESLEEPKEKDEWDTRLCYMPQVQSDAYIKACSDVRSILARSTSFWEGSDDSKNIASAFIQLRKHVFHPDLAGAYELLQRLSLHRATASQPDIYTARSLMARSGKLQQLAAILVQEFNCGFTGGNGDVRLLFDESRKHRVKPPAEGVSRLVILSSLPEIQAVISGLLSLLGIEHVVLSNEEGPKTTKYTQAQSQLLLSKFNESSKGEEGVQTQVIVTSPLVVSGDHCGLSADNADAVLLVDEDWSGAEELIIEALAARCRFRRKTLGLEACRFVRLVAKDTCESGFLECNTQRAVEAGQGRVFTVDVNGLYGTRKAVVERCNGTDLSITRPLSSATFSFPGWTLFNLFGSDLDEVLVGGKELNVLPFIPRQKMNLCPSSDDKSLNLRVRVLCALLKEEHSLRFGKSLAKSGSRVSVSDTMRLGDRIFRRLFRPTTQSPELQKRIIEDQLFGSSGQAPTCLFIPEGHDPTEAKAQEPASMARRRDIALVKPTRTSSEIVSSALFYLPNRPLQQPSSKRANFFAVAFGAERQESVIFDGNQGSEPLVYFPPLFPRMRECGILAYRDVAALRSQIYPLYGQPGEGGVTTVGDGSITADDTEVQRVITEDEASRSDAASVIIDISDDFGLAGMGAVPLPRDSVLAASTQTTNSSGRWSDPPLPYDWGDFQELGRAGYSDLDTVLLLSNKKRPRQFADSTIHHAPHRGSLNGLSHAPPLAASTMGFDAASKKFKAGPTQGVRTSISSASVPSAPPNKDVHLHQLLMSLRQYGRGSMFEAPIYRVASVRIRNKVSDRLMRHAWNGPAFEAGPGLPLLVSKQQHPASTPGYRGMFDVDTSLWTSIVKRLSNREATTGDEAVELSIGQKNSLRRSLVSPSRVDFGPFQSGFLSSTTGASVGAPQRSRVGVSLPMGVKIAPTSKDQLPLPWTSDDDRRLHDSAVRTGMNWILTAAELSGFKDVTISSKSESRSYHCSRSARACRDRWQRLARNNPGMVLKVRQSERYLNGLNEMPDADGDVGKRLEKPTVKNNTMLIRSNPRISEPINAKPRTFHAVRTAKVRRQTALPLQIPGVAPGAQPTTSPPHQSHDQAIKTSVASSWTGGRTDMWPLHLLDAADRADSASRHSAISTRTESASNRR